MWCLCTFSDTCCFSTQQVCCVSQAVCFCTQQMVFAQVPPQHGSTPQSTVQPCITLESTMQHRTRPELYNTPNNTPGIRSAPTPCCNPPRHSPVNVVPAGQVRVPRPWGKPACHVPRYTAPSAYVCTPSPSGTPTTGVVVAQACCAVASLSSVVPIPLVMTDMQLTHSCMCRIIAIPSNGVIYCIINWIYSLIIISPSQ